MSADSDMTTAVAAWTGDIDTAVRTAMSTTDEHGCTAGRIISDAVGTGHDSRTVHDNGPAVDGSFAHYGVD